MGVERQVAQTLTPQLRSYVRLLVDANTSCAGCNADFGSAAIQLHVHVMLVRGGLHGRRMGGDTARSGGRVEIHGRIACRKLNGSSSTLKLPG